MSFEALGVSEAVGKNLAAKGYENPTEIQAGSIPVILEKKDVVLQSHTGSGKTAAFGIPVVQMVMPDVPAVQFVVLVPTRELAAQVYREIESLAKGTGVKVASIYGGADMGRQIQALRDGAQIVIGTPGRVLDHLKRRTMSFSVVRGIVLDEADKMLSMGFFPDMQAVFRQLPKRRQAVMSSATFPFEVERIINQYMVEPVRITISSDDIAPKEIDHAFINVDSNEKERALLSLLEMEEPELSFIFCNTKAEVKSVHLFLENAGLPVAGMSSDLSQTARERSLRRLRNGAVRHLVCTDVAARGIDVPALSHVFCFSTGGDPETYVHRTGRTGRAGKSGKAISIISTHDLAAFRGAMKTNEIEIREITMPTPEQINKARLEHHMEYFKSIDFAKDADIREDYLELASKLTDEQVRTLLPFLLEQFRSGKTVTLEEPETPPMRDDAPPSREPDSRGPRGRGRGRDRGDRGDRNERGDRGGRGGRGGRGPRDRNERGDRDRGGRDRNRRGREQGDRQDRGERTERPDRVERVERTERQERPERREVEAQAPRQAPETNEPRGQEQASSGRGPKRFTKVVMGLGRQDGLDVMDVQNILRRQGRARMDDIGDIVMKDHECFIQIGSGSLKSVLAADGKHYKSFEIFVSEVDGK